MSAAEANVKAVLEGEKLEDSPGLRDASCLSMTTQSLSADYPLYASSLLNLIKASEGRIDRIH